MKFVTTLFAFLGILTAVAALPLSDFDVRDTSSGQALEERFVDLDDPIFARYFGPTADIIERDALVDTDAPIEKRQEAKAIVKVAKLIVKGIIKIVELIKNKIAQDKDKRGKWTSSMVGEFKKKYPSFNFVVCHTDHKTDFKGVKGKDWGHSHHEVPVSFSKTVGYEVYWFREGTFHRIGDGGYLNWAYIGNVKKTSDGGKTVVFAKP